MPKNNKGKNAFYFFMLDWKKRAEAAGRTFPNGLQDVQRDPQCSEEWQTISKQQKGIYEARAKDSKVAAQGSMEKKTTLGESLREIEENKKREQEFEQAMHRYIDSVIAMGMRHNNLDKTKFIFIHVNKFFDRALGNYKRDVFPAEFAVADFSLENGIESVYHEIIGAPIPIGYRANALQESESSHQIPPELAEGQKDFGLMFTNLVDFLQCRMTGNKYPPLFTTKEVAPAVHSLLTRMTDAAHESSDKFPIYSLEVLFSALRNAAAQSADGLSIPFVVAEYEFAKDLFSSTRGLECSFHKNIDGTAQYCSMAIVKRWGFTICDYCCEYLSIDMIPGVHCPLSHWSYDNAEDDTLEASLSHLSIDSARNKVLSMTGVSQEYRVKVSERTHKEEQRRRNECRPLEITDHSKLNTKPILQESNTSSINERPLRQPNTTPYALITQENTRPPLNDSQFPPIGGRGVGQRKQKNDFKLALGRGRGSS